ncbi:MAG: type II secretion system F family protein, partial [Patescibacteria group bacterium]
MATFKYVALTKDNKKVSGTTEAKNEAQITELLTRQDLRVLSVTKEGGFSLSNLNEINIGSNNPKLEDIVVFTRQLATMINAGVPLVRSLATMLEQTEHPGFKKIIAEISKDVESGMAFADALEKHDQIFSPIYINMVKAFELFANSRVFFLLLSQLTQNFVQDTTSFTG